MVYSSATLATSIAAGAALGVALGAYFVARGSRQSEAGTLRQPRLPKRLILVRHGQSEGNIDPLLYCNVPDNAMHLTELGFQQAITAGNCIKKIIGDETAVRFLFRMAKRWYGDAEWLSSFLLFLLALYCVALHPYHRDIPRYHQGVGKEV
jgi:hypothetical protein